MNNTRQTLVLARAWARHFSKTAAQNAENEVVRPKFHQLKEIQKKFGVQDNVPVYLKGGVGDRLLYQATVVLTIIGFGMCLETYYRLAVK